MGRQQQLKKERKTKKIIQQIINNHMLQYCIKYCDQHQIKFDDLDTFQKLALVQDARTHTLQDIKR